MTLNDFRFMVEAIIETTFSYPITKIDISIIRISGEYVLFLMLYHGEKASCQSWTWSACRAMTPIERSEVISEMCRELIGDGLDEE